MLKHLTRRTYKNTNVQNEKNYNTEKEEKGKTLYYTILKRKNIRGDGTSAKSYNKTVKIKAGQSRIKGTVQIMCM